METLSRRTSLVRAPRGVHHAEMGAGAVEGDAEIAGRGAHRGLELLQVLRHGRVGVVIGKVAVDALIQQNVHARQPGDDGGQHLARRAVAGVPGDLQGSPSRDTGRSEEHTSELQSLMRISYAVFCLKKKKKYQHIKN